MPAPKPKKIPKILEAHEDLRTDNYYWLRDDCLLYTSPSPRDCT